MHMKRSLKSIFFLVVLTIIIFGCKNDDTDTVVFPYANIVSYNVPGQVGSALINKAERTVHIVVEFDRALDFVIPNIGISSNATIVPESGEAVNFETTGKVKYVVMSES